MDTFSSGLACSAEMLYFANKCDVLLSLFTCEEGCGHQIGPELPAYVDDPRLNIWVLVFQYDCKFLGY